MDEKDFVVGSIDFSKHRTLNTRDVFIVVQILKRCAKQLISLLEMWERGEDV